MNLFDLQLQMAIPFEPVHEYSFATFIDYMQKDKKASFGKLNFVLLEIVGQSICSRNYNRKMPRSF